MTRAGVRLALEHPDLAIGLVQCDGVRIGPAGPALAAEIAGHVAQRVTGSPVPEALRLAVRDMLRWGGFKPTGRNKPASEYLAGAAERGAFPSINNVVDVANLMSLASGLPISLLDLDRALGDGEALVIRLGQPGEAFAFNTAGQVIEVEGLVSVARSGGPPIANPVKDAMVVKTQADTRRVLAVVYAPPSAQPLDALDARLAEFAERLEGSAEGHAESWRLP
jgi:DNA/RNA-binding domain of Phe-tRNA-synthetase-like protein